MVLDLESEICQSYTGVSALAIDPDEIPTMDQVARRPRAELHEKWSATASAAAGQIAGAVCLVEAVLAAVDRFVGGGWRSARLSPWLGGKRDDSQATD